MKPLTLIGIALIIAGAAGLAYGGFSYTRDTHEATIGSLQLSISEKQHVNVPLWLGAGAILVGIALVVRNKA
jgi:TRAP-type C4-dicarboxylate transport system permease small subunit